MVSTQRGFREKVAPDRGERRECLDVDNEIREKQVTTVIDGRVKISNVPKCI